MDTLVDPATSTVTDNIGIYVGLAVLAFALVSALVAKWMGKLTAYQEFLDRLQAKITRLFDVYLLLAFYVLVLVVAPVWLLTWFEAHLPGWPFYIILAWSWISFLYLLVLSSGSGFFDYLVDNSPKYKVGAAVDRQKGGIIGLTLPLIFILAIGISGVYCFAALTSTLATAGHIHFEPLPHGLNISAMAELYVWHALDLIPQIGITKAYHWPEPFAAYSRTVALLVVIFKFIIAFILIKLFKAWWDWRKNTPTDVADAKPQ